MLSIDRGKCFGYLVSPSGISFVVSRGCKWNISAKEISQAESVLKLHPSAWGIVTVVRSTRFNRIVHETALKEVA